MPWRLGLRRLKVTKADEPPVVIHVEMHMIVFELHLQDANV
jgi:hypothetical protein